jgi:hypothetical protein
MNWRMTFILPMLAAGFSLTVVSPASADPPPWAGVWRHNKHVSGERYDRFQGRWRDGDDRGKHYDRSDWRWHRHEGDGHSDHREAYARRYREGYGGYRAYDPQYGKLMDRMAYDRAKIAEITPTGRHRKALQWYKDDLQNARRDLNNYRYRGSSSPPPTPYDPYYQPSGLYDPYANDTGRSFDWKNDWPLLVGQLLTQPR